MKTTEMPATRLTKLLLLLIVDPNLCLAQQALVRSYADPALSIGQAYLTHYGEQCIALLPTHVAMEAGTPAFLLEGSALLGESDAVSDLGDDLSLALVSGSASGDCGYSMSTLSRAVNGLIRNQGLATLRSVNGDASLARMAVAIIDDDGHTYLRVRPTRDRIQIRKGHSGSLLMIRDKPVGMLLSVNARHGVGKILRFDALLSRAEEHLADAAQAQPTMQPATTTGAARADLAAAANGGRITGWNTLPVDAEHRAANLIGSTAAPYWRSRTETWPVEVAVDLAGEKVVINRIELDGSGVPDPGELPKRVEIFVNVSSEGENWRSLVAREAQYDASDVAVFTLAPTWARQVKIAIGDSRDSVDTTSLRRVRISGP
jgi:hypothetical protein